MSKTWKIIILISSLLLAFLVFRLFFMRYYYDFLEYWTLRDKIVWSNERKLKWSDFPYNNEDSGLYTSLALLSRFNVNDPILFRSHTVFIPKESYISDTTDIINLRFAQAKFDLLEIYRRKMVSEVDSLKKITNKNLKPSDFELMNHIYYDMFKDEWKNYIDSDIESLNQLEKKLKIELKNSSPAGASL